MTATHMPAHLQIRASVCEIHPDALRDDWSDGDPEALPQPPSWLSTSGPTYTTCSTSDDFYDDEYVSGEEDFSEWTGVNQDLRPYRINEVSGEITYLPIY